MATTGAPRARPGDSVGGRLRDHVSLGVHGVVVEVLGRDGLERPEAHVQRDARDVAAANGESPEHSVRHVQARSGRRDGPVVAGEYGLVTRGVYRLVLPLDVGRERHVPARAQRGRYRTRRPD